MEKYMICYGAGVIDYCTGTLQDAMDRADDGARYTCRGIDINDREGNLIAARRWYSIPYCGEENPDYYEENPIIFGSHGYYGDWEVY